MNNRPAGFTINLSHFLRDGEVEDGVYLRTTNHRGATNKMNIFVHSDYNFGYFSGAYLAKGNTNIAKYKRTHYHGFDYYDWRGSVQFRPRGVEDKIPKLQEVVKETFNLRLVPYMKPTQARAIIYSMPLAFFCERFFLKTKDKRLPENFYVDNHEYLQGVYDGITDWGLTGYSARLQTSPHVPKLYKRIKSDLGIDSK